MMFKPARSRSFLPFLVIFFCAIFAFQSLDQAFSFTFISEETELAMGKGADRQVVAQYGLYQDKPLQLYVNRVGQKLVSKLSDKVFSKYFFKIVDSSEINAFALPGGYIYVTRGILALLNSEAELAGVLGHEIGHVIFHHGAKQMVRMIGAQIIALGGAIANPKNAGEWLVVSTQLFNQINLGYGREAELESDDQGLVNIFEAGYDPANIGRFFRTLRRQEIMSGQSYHSFAASHPETKERIINAEMKASSLLRRGKHVVDNREIYLSQLKGLAYGGKKHKGDHSRYKPEYVDIYEVAPGDTFASIAEKELGGTSMGIEIAILNGKREKDPLVPGELLKIIKKGVPQPSKSLEIQPPNLP